MATPATLDVLFRDLIEDDINRHQPLVWAAQSGGVTNPEGIKKRSEILDWAAMESLLKMLAYSPGTDDPWTLLGLPQGMGPLPSVEMIDQRSNTGVLIASIADGPGWSQDETNKATDWREKVERARRECIEDLPRELRERRKRKQEAPIPRWQEPGPDLLTFLGRDLQPQTHKLVLHLSNLQGADLGGNTGTLGVMDSRRMYSLMSKGAGGSEELLAGIRGGEVTMWAPDGAGVFQAFMAAFYKLILSDPTQISVRFLIPHSPLPGCDSPEAVLDLWSHSVFTSKHKTLIKKVEFLRQPSRCVFSGSVNPLFHLKSLVMVTIAGGGASIPMKMIQWRPTLADFDSGQAIYVDCNSDEELLTHTVLTRCPLAGLVGWDGPRRSLGAASAAPRSLFVGFFLRGTITDMDIRLHISHLREQAGLQGVLIGSRSLFNNKATMLVDMGGPRAIEEMLHLTDEVVLVSRRLAIILSGSTAREWEEAITDQATRDPLEAVEKIRFRGSRNGGRPWVKPAIIESRARGDRARAAATKLPPKVAEAARLRFTMGLQDVSTCSPDALIAVLIQQAERATGIELKTHVGTGPLQPREWEPIADHAGKWLGKIDIQALTEDDFRVFHEGLHGLGVEVDGLCLILEVESLHLKVPDDIDMGLGSQGVPGRS